MEGCPLGWAIICIPKRMQDTLLWMLIFVNPCWNYLPNGECWSKSRVDHLLCQTITWQATDGWLHHRIFGLSTIGNKRLQICSFRSSGYIIITFQFNYLKTVLSTVYQCLAFSYAGPALNYFESRPATGSSVYRYDHPEQCIKGWWSLVNWTDLMIISSNRFVDP